MLKLAVVLEPCEEGGYAASVPTIPGCFSQGETEQEAMENIVEAIELHLEAFEDDLFTDSEDVLIRELHWKLTPDSDQAPSGPEPGSQAHSESESRGEAEPEQKRAGDKSSKREIAL